MNIYRIATSLCRPYGSKRTKKVAAYSPEITVGLGHDLWQLNFRLHQTGHTKQLRGQVSGNVTPSTAFTTTETSGYKLTSDVCDPLQSELSGQQ